MPRSGGSPRDRGTVAFFARPVLEVGPEVLGGVLRRETAEGAVALRITEVEAYDGEVDEACHAFRGRTARNASLFGPPGHLYCYLIYGIHHSLNLVCGAVDRPCGLLVRAGEVVEGIELARRRRARPDGTIPADHRLGRGPGCVGQVFAADLGDDGDRLDAGEWSFAAATSAVPVRSGPRVGVSRAADLPWRFSIPGEPSVSAYRRAKQRA